MRKLLTTLPYKVQKHIHASPGEKHKLHPVISQSIICDITGSQKLFKYDKVIAHHNPLKILSELMFYEGTNEEILIVMYPDYSESVMFPYNLLELANVRAFYEKLIVNSVSVGEEGLNQWFLRLLLATKEKLTLRGNRVSVLNGFNVLNGSKSFLSENGIASILYVDPKKSDAGIDRAPDSLAIKNKLLGRVRDDADFASVGRGGGIVFIEIPGEFPFSELFQSDEMFDNLLEWMKSCNAAMRDYRDKSL